MTEHRPQNCLSSVNEKKNWTSTKYKYYVRQVTVIPAHKKLVKFHQVKLDFSDLTEKLESNGQILNQTLRHISALEIALRRSQQKEPSNFSEDFYEQASNLANNTFVLSGVAAFMVFLKFKNLNAWLFLFNQFQMIPIS